MLYLTEVFNVTRFIFFWTLEFNEDNCHKQRSRLVRIRRD